MTNLFEIKVPANHETTTVNKTKFKFWCEFGWDRGTWVQNEATGELKKIAEKYLSNDLTVRKAIATCFGLPTFRK